MMCPTDEADQDAYSDGMGLAIFWQGNSASYHYMPASVAFSSRANALVADISTTALITAADLAAPFGGAAAEATVASVGAAICQNINYPTSSLGNLNIREWRISAIPILGGAL